MEGVKCGIWKKGIFKLKQYKWCSQGVEMHNLKFHYLYYMFCFVMIDEMAGRST